jgi:hypothetical protein
MIFRACGRLPWYSLEATKRRLAGAEGDAMKQPVVQVEIRIRDVAERSGR